ncbi:MAG: AMP-binding protein [Alphaproteobacteria bacterium]|nr:AMP-binding protein [Alphaproteobacteria bacterium]NNF71942.1 AMP-binding protein [Paracoccaceae bacterium]
MSEYFDRLETRTADERAADQGKMLQVQTDRARALPGYSAVFEGVDPVRIDHPDALVNLPVLRKGALLGAQKPGMPFGGFAAHAASGFDHVFQSPGPIYEPGQTSTDWWRFGRFLHALGLGSGDIIQNCFSYHMTPAGMMFENGARAVGATVFPAGVGQTELQVQAAHHLGVTAYAGTPDYLKTLLEAADAADLPLQITRAAVSGGALFPSLRQAYADRGITCLQCYGTADLGNIAYESPAQEGLIVDEGVIVEIVRPGTGDRVPEGEVGEVVVTSLTPDYPLIRFATGDLSAVMTGQSPCGRTNMRIKGWMGRADQTTKIKGMFVRPEQVAEFVARHDEVSRARVIATRENEQDVMTVQIETEICEPERFAKAISDTLKLRGTVELVAPGSLPNDGKVIDDQRSYD